MPPPPLDQQFLARVSTNCHEIRAAELRPSPLIAKDRTEEANSEVAVPQHFIS
jgi:hypothetical protein